MEYIVLASLLVAALYLITRPSRGATIWGFVDVIGVYLAASLVAAVSASLLYLRGRTVSAPPLLTVSVLLVVQSAVLVVGVLYLVLIKYRLSPASVGLHVDRTAERITQGLAGAIFAWFGNEIGALLTIVLLGLSMGQVAAEKFVAGQQARIPIYSLRPELHTVSEIALLVIVVGIVVPIGEEIFFRGLVLGMLRRVLNRYAAIVMSAVFFAVAHLAAVEMFSLVMLGLVLGYLYVRTESLLPGILAHGVNNLAALFVHYGIGLGALHVVVSPSFGRISMID